MWQSLDPFFQTCFLKCQREAFKLLICVSVLLFKGAFVVICAPCLWSGRVIYVWELLSALERHYASLHSFRLCPRSLINAAQTVHSSFPVSFFPPSLTSPSSACYFPHMTHTHTHYWRLLECKRQTDWVLVCVREGSLLQMTGCPLAPNWNLSFPTSLVAHSIIMCICLCLSGLVVLVKKG